MKRVSALWFLPVWIALLGGGWWLRREWLPRTIGPASRGDATSSIPKAPHKPGAAAAAGSGKAAAPRSPEDIALAVRRCDSFGDPLATRERMLELVEGLSAGELAAAMPRLFGDRVFRTLAAQRWAELDPPALYGFLRGLPFLESDRNDERDEVSSILFRTWTRLDPEAAYPAAKREQHNPIMDNGLWSVISSTLTRDPVAGLRMAEGLAVDGRFERINAAEITPENAEAFARAWADLPPGQRFESRIPLLARKAFAAWAEASPTGALEWVRTRSDAERVEHIPVILKGLAAKDFPAALTAFDSLPPSPERERAGPALAARLAATDPAAAIAWAESNLASGRGEAMSEVAAAVAATDPRKAAALIDSLAPGSSRDQFVASTARTWAEQDLAAAAEWAQGFANGPERRHAIGALADTWLERHPESFAAYAAEAPHSEIPDHLLARTASTLAAKDPAQAVSWMLGLGGERSEQALAGAIGHETFSEQPERLSALLGALPSGPKRDDAIRQALATFAGLAPERAQTWLATVPPGPVRERVASFITETSGLDAKTRSEWTKSLSSGK